MARFILLLTLPIFASCSEEFIFWAKYSVSNHILTSRQAVVSVVMKESNATTFSHFCSINDPKNPNESSIDYLNRHINELEECFIDSKIVVLDSTRTMSRNINSKTNITYIPIRFIVDFKDFGAKIGKIAD